MAPIHKNQSFIDLKKPFEKAVKVRLETIRQSGSLGHGSLKHASIREFVLPLSQVLSKMPRYTTCLRLVEHIDSKFVLCPSGQNKETWLATQARKLHSWLLAAGRLGLTISEMTSHTRVSIGVYKF